MDDVPVLHDKRLLDLALRERRATYLADGTAALVRGDALAVLQRLPSGCADLLFADPPYGLSAGGTSVASGKRVSVDKGAWDDPRRLADFYSWNLAWLRSCQRVLAPTGTLWVSGTRHSIFAVGHAVQQLGYHVLNFVTWHKPNAAPNLGCRTFAESCEHLLWAAPQRAGTLAHCFAYDFMKADNGGKQMRDVWEIPTPGPREKMHGKHPTQKPLALLDRIVLACSLPGAIVIDPFCGSGTTGVAAVQQGRRFVGIDLDQRYLDLANKRIAAVGNNGTS